VTLLLLLFLGFFRVVQLLLSSSNVMLQKEEEYISSHRVEAKYKLSNLREDVFLVFSDVVFYAAFGAIRP